MGRKAKKAAKKQAAADAAAQAKYDKELSQTYWGEYSQWQADTAANYEQQMAGYRSKYANNPEMLDIFSQKAQSDLKAEQESLLKGERGTFLTNYYNQQGGAKSGLSMEDWYTRQYGNTAKGIDADPIKEANQRTGKLKDKLLGKFAPKSVGEAAVPGSGFFSQLKQGGKGKWW